MFTEKCRSTNYCKIDPSGTGCIVGPSIVHQVSVNYLISLLEAWTQFSW